MPKSQSKNPVVAHSLLASVASGIAGEMFEQLMGDNDYRRALRAKHPDISEAQLRKWFVSKYADQCLPQARATLTAMLRGPYNDDLKQNIADALILDRSLRSVHGDQPPQAPTQESH